jgi:nicotinamidase-related amidase
MVSRSDLKQAALLSMDYQNGIVASYGGGPELLDRATGVLDNARDLGIRVIHVHVGFRPGFPEVNPRNAMFGAILSSPERRKMFEGGGADIHAAVAPINDEVIITKHRVSAFSNSDLDMTLRANDIDTLVMYGIATSGVVLSTLVDAADRDYKIFVIKDCCADQDAELHDALIDRYFPKRGVVITSEEFASL